MKIPKSFPIKGHTWQVTYKWSLKGDDGVKLNGLCDQFTRTIYIDRLLSKEDKWLTFLHELVHAVLFESHINDNGVEGIAEEVICDAIADVFSSLFDLKWKRGVRGE